MKNLVTGGAGFIGSFLCEELIERGEEVICFDNFWRGKRENIEHLEDNEDFTLVEGDIRDYKEVEEAVKGCDHIYHLAAVNGTKYFYEKPLLILETNINGTKNVLEAAERNGKPKVTFASSSEVYGEPKNVPTREDEECVLDNPTVTMRHSYSSSKMVGEYLCMAYHEKYDLPVSIIRYFNVYGPRLIGTSYGQVVSIFFNQALNDDPLTVYGDGEQTRSFTYVKDSVKGTIQVAKSDKANGEVLNLGRGKETTINQLAEKVIEISGKDVEKTYEPLPEGDCKRRCPEIKKVKKLTSWESTIDLEKGLNLTHDWFINNSP